MSFLGFYELIGFVKGGKAVFAFFVDLYWIDVLYFILSHFDNKTKAIGLTKSTQITRFTVTTLNRQRPLKFVFKKENPILSSAFLKITL